MKGRLGEWERWIGRGLRRRIDQRNSRLCAIELRRRAASRGQRICVSGKVRRRRAVGRGCGPEVHAGKRSGGYSSS